MHTALWVLAITSLVGAGVSLLRPTPRRPQHQEVRVGGELRIGEVARLTGTTPRTIRYYEEIGLLPAAGRPPAGQATAATTRATSSG